MTSFEFVCWLVWGWKSSYNKLLFDFPATENTSDLIISRYISSSDRLLPNWQQTWHIQQHGWSGMFFDISCAPVALHHLTVILAANSRLWALREPLAHKSQGDTNCVCVCVYVYLYILLEHGMSWATAIWVEPRSCSNLCVCVCVYMCLNPLPLTDREVN